jgi:serine phosphatase RsbU (regulator of sigma subunit)
MSHRLPCLNCREKQIASTLQSVLLSPLPSTYGPLSLASRHRAGSASADVGGDFYAFFPRRDGRAGLILGDIQGQGLEAASRIAALRYTAEAYARIGLDPDTTVQLLNTQLMEDSEGGRATLLYLAIEPESGVVEMVNAGHEPPLLWREREQTWEPLFFHQNMLGLTGDSAYAPTRLQLQPGDMLVLYTDGVASVMPRQGEWSTDDLLRNAIEPSPSPRSLVGRLSAAHPGGNDDAALVALQWKGRNASLLRKVESPEHLVCN